MLVRLISISHENEHYSNDLWPFHCTTTHCSVLKHGNLPFSALWNTYRIIPCQAFQHREWTDPNLSSLVIYPKSGITRLREAIGILDHEANRRQWIWNNNKNYFKVLSVLPFGEEIQIDYLSFVPRYNFWHDGIWMGWNQEWMRQGSSQEIPRLSRRVLPRSRTKMTFIVYMVLGQEKS